MDVYPLVKVPLVNNLLISSFKIWLKPCKTATINIRGHLVFQCWWIKWQRFTVRNLAGVSTRWRKCWSLRGQMAHLCHLSVLFAIKVTKLSASNHYSLCTSTMLSSLKVVYSVSLLKSKTMSGSLIQRSYELLSPSQLRRSLCLTRLTTLLVKFSPGKKCSKSQIF